jgi:hypothetical protein
MRLPDGAAFKLVYQCRGEAAHEETVTVDSYQDIDLYMYAAAGFCGDCQTEYKVNTLVLDRIEVVVEPHLQQSEPTYE